MVRYIGDAAGLGKLGKFAETIAKAVDLVKADLAFAAAIKPALDQLAAALKQVPLDALPRPAREAIASMQSKLDEFAVPAAKRGAEGVVPHAVKVTPDAKGSINGLPNASFHAPRFIEWVDSGGTVYFDEATDTFVHTKTIETSGHGTNQVDITYREGKDGIARPDFTAYTRSIVQIPTSLPKDYAVHFKAANEALGNKLRADAKLADKLGLTAEQAPLITEQPPGRKS
ncbi:MAG: hypothetical protein LH480_05595 [Rubrivivax sp.]|nr:hypothetical protein [Rubrivivax sp.]